MTKGNNSLVDGIAAKLWNEDVTDLNFTVELAKKKTVNCVSPVRVHNAIDANVPELINKLKEIRIRSIALRYNV